MSSTPLIALGIFAFFTLALGLSVALLIQARSSPRAKLKARVSAVAGRAEVTIDAEKSDNSRRARQIQSKLKELETGNAARRRTELRQRIEQAGLKASIRQYYAWSAVVGVAGTVVYVLMGYPLLGAIPVLIAMGLGAPRMYLGWLVGKRQSRFTENFADAIDVIVRGIRSGLPVGECLNIIARESPEPIGPEFHLLVEGQKVGMTLSEVLDRAVRRMPTTDMKFFAIVLIMQQQTGGNLGETLANLSGILRSRKKMAQKIRSMSSEARMTALIIGALPFLLSGMIYLISPDYMSILWTDSLGKILLFGGLGWMSLGILVMKQLVSFKI